MQRRERTRHLIELGGLVQKAGLVDLTDDDRATIYGALLELVGKARREAGDDTLALWKRRGRRAFAMDEKHERQHDRPDDGVPSMISPHNRTT
ncbi:conjugal transfer protein TraD [Sphingomonas sp. PB2P12]